MHVNWQFCRKWNINRWKSNEMDVWQSLQLYLTMMLIWLQVSTRSHIFTYITLVGEIPKENTTILSDLLYKFRSRKGENLQTTVSRVSQPAAYSGSTYICSNPSEDEGPLITWTGLTVRASCSRWSSGEEKSGAASCYTARVARDYGWTMFPLTELTSFLQSPALPPQLINTSVFFPLPLLFHVLQVSDTLQIPSRTANVPAATVAQWGEQIPPKKTKSSLLTAQSLSQFCG